jgi:hypothetical protein
VAQIRLQEELEELFAAIDKAKGQATGMIPKAREDSLHQGPRMPRLPCDKLHWCTPARHTEPPPPHHTHTPSTLCPPGAGRPPHRLPGLLQGGAAGRQEPQAL